MKINPTGFERIYSSGLHGNETAGNKSVENEKNDAVDRADISEDALNHTEFDEILANAVKDVEKGTDPDKLRRLRAEIQNNTYFVDGSDIASKMLGMNEDDE